MADDVGIKDGNDASVTIAAKDIGGVLHPIHLIGDSTTGDPLDTSLPAEIVGNKAAAATDSGNPVKIGGTYKAAPTLLTDGQRGDAQQNSYGDLRAQIIALSGTGADGLSNAAIGFAGVPGNHTNARALSVAPSLFNGTTWDRFRGTTSGLQVISPPGWSYAAASGGIDNTTTAVTLKAAAGAGVKNYLKSLQIDHDTLGAATEIAVRDGAGGTVLWRGKLQTTAVEGQKIVFDPPLASTANTLLEFVTLSAVTGDVLVNAQGYTGP